MVASFTASQQIGETMKLSSSKEVKVLKENQ